MRSSTSSPVRAHACSVSSNPTASTLLSDPEPSGSAPRFAVADDLGIGPEFLGRVRVGTSLASIFGIWAYRAYLQEVPIKSTLKWTAIASSTLGLSQLLLVTHANRALGIPDTLFTFGDDLILTVIGQLAFMPLLVLAASLCPPGVEGTLFGAAAARRIAPPPGRPHSQSVGDRATRADRVWQRC